MIQGKSLFAGNHGAAVDNGGGYKPAARTVRRWAGRLADHPGSTLERLGADAVPSSDTLRRRRHLDHYGGPQDRMNERRAMASSLLSSYLMQGKYPYSREED